MAPMKFFVLMPLMFIYLSCWYSSLLAAVISFFMSVIFLIPNLHLDWRGFFLAWIYISGMFTLLVYSVTFTVNKKSSLILGPLIFMSLFMFSDLDLLVFGPCFDFLFFNSSYMVYTLIILFCVSLLPLISYFFGPTTSCRKSV